MSLTLIVEVIDRIDVRIFAFRYHASERSSGRMEIWTPIYYSSNRISLAISEPSVKFNRFIKAVRLVSLQLDPVFIGSVRADDTG